MCVWGVGCGAGGDEEAAEPVVLPASVVEAVPPSREDVLGAFGGVDKALALLEQTERALDPRHHKTVGELIRKRKCSTAPTRALNIQLAAQMNCLKPDFFEPIDGIENVRLDPAANPFLQRPAAEALAKVAGERPDTEFTINSSWRSVAQQHILKRWQGSCGVRIAADPGTSHHESGLAIDVKNQTTDAFRKQLKRGGWQWYCDRTNRGRFRGCSDPPHHTFRGGRDLRSLNVLAFQKLWNHANPDDPISETGRYNSATAKRLDKTPLAGFTAGPTCQPTNPLLVRLMYPNRVDDRPARQSILAEAVMRSAEAASVVEVAPVPAGDDGVAALAGMLKAWTPTRALINATLQLVPTEG